LRELSWSVAGIGGFLAWQHYQSTATVATPARRRPGGPEADQQPARRRAARRRIEGDVNAPITMIEYSSLSCPHCARFQKDVLPQIKKEFIDTGKVKLIQRDFPLNKPAVQAAQLAHCAGPMRYSAWSMCCSRPRTSG
jgi:protein-disulfide isomerase